MSDEQRNPDDEQQRVADEVAGRLRRDGVDLTGQETPDELVRVLEAVERFQAAVERHGGDLMMDAPIGDDSPIAPDHRAFVLPERQRHESIESFLGQIAEATARAGKVRDRP